jgi:hypothetical protein
MFTWPASFAGGRAWFVVRRLGTRLRGGVRRDAGWHPALARHGLGAEACLESVLEAPPPRDPEPWDQRRGDLS